MVRAVILFFVAAVFCSLGDAAHVAQKVDGYPPIYRLIPFLNIPWWVPLEFGAAGLAIGFTTKFLDPLIRYQANRPINRERVVLSGVGFFFLYLSSAYLPLSTPGSMDLFLGISALLFWWIFDGSWKGLAMASGGAVVGTGVEMTLVQAGVFFYEPGYSQLHGVPSWLPWLYLPAVIAGGHLFRADIGLK